VGETAWTKTPRLSGVNPVTLSKLTVTPPVTPPGKENGTSTELPLTEGPAIPWPAAGRAAIRKRTHQRKILFMISPP
jgi:hypothetical protein